MNARNITNTFSTPDTHHALSSRRWKPFRRDSVSLVAGTRRLALLLAFVSSTTLAVDYQLDTIVDDLRWPWSVVRLPDSSFLITEREGRLLHLNTNGSRTELEGTPPTVFAGQGGFFDVVLHPEFEKNQLIYLSYAEGREDANGTAIYRARFADGRLSDGKQILRVTPDKTTPQHYGGRMAFLPDGSLIMSSGEGFEHREEAQNRESELGKVLRVTDSGDPLGLRSKTDDLPTRVWTLGHRNPQGLAVDPLSGDIYLHEHGPRGGDELNILEAGSNYGWPAVTHGVDYSGAYVSPFKSAPGMVDPLWTWVPSIAPSGMAWYNGNRFPQWRNSLFIGALVDREVRRLEILNGKVVEEEALFSELETRIRDIRVFGEDIYILTDGEQGALIQVQNQ